VSSFDLVLRTEGSLHPGGEPDRFVSAHSGVIRRIRDRDGRVFNIGLVKAYRIHAAQAEEAGEVLFDVCDGHSQQLHEVYAALFDPHTDDLKEEVRARFDVFDNDILVLDYVLLSPRWRGLKLGLLAARKMLDLLGGGCGLAVCWAYPLNPNAGEFSKVPAGWVPRHAGEHEQKEARRKLRRHFRRLGFRRVAKTRFDALPLSRRTPTLEDIVRPGS
jgi:hypothetical protein